MIETIARNQFEDKTSCIMEALEKLLSICTRQVKKDSRKEKYEPLLEECVKQEIPTKKKKIIK